jgi:hypothetical protein
MEPAGIGTSAEGAAQASETILGTWHDILKTIIGGATPDDAGRPS